MKAQEQPAAASLEVKDNTELTLDILRAGFFGKMFEFYLNVVAGCKLPTELDRSVITNTLRSTERFEREIHRIAKDKKYNVYLTRNLKKEKLLDMITVMDCMCRVGSEEHQDIYEEFLGLLINAIDAVFYAQQNRRNIHFGKYKALFKLISDELKRDVNRQPGQVLFTNKGELFLRSAPPCIEENIK